MKAYINNTHTVVRIFCLCILSIALFSCGDFLDVDNYFKQTTQLDSVFKSKMLTEQYIRGAASFIPNEADLWTLAGDKRRPGLPFQGASDENFTSFNDDRHPAIKFLLDEMTPFYEERFFNYPRCYEGIRKASIVLQRIGEVEDISDMDRRDFIGRCYFLKGYYYYLLLLQYGPVPIVPEQAFSVGASVDEMSLERATYDECVEKICEYLEKAAEYLYSERPSSEKSLPTSGAALAVLSRVLLQAASPWFNGGSGGLYTDWVRKSDGAHFISQAKDNQKWGKAAVAAKRVMNTQLYELYITKRKSDTPPLPEAVSQAYAIRPIEQFNPAEIDAYRSFAEVFNGDIPVEMNDEIIYSCVSEGGRDSPAGIAMPSFMGGMNGLNLTQDVVDAFYMADGSAFSLPSNHWEAIGRDKKFSGYTLKANAAKMYDNREMRFYVTIGFNHCFWPASSYTGNDASLKNIEVTYYNDGNAGPPANHAVDYNHSGYTCKKYVHLEDNNKATIKSKAFPTFRYAEVLLNYAEALNELDGTYTQGELTVTGRNENEILNAFNQIRYRAGIPGLTSLPSREEMRDLIKAERRIEFACEGRRYHDIRRWGDAQNAYNKPVLGMNIKAKKSEREAFHTIITLNDDKARRYFSYKNYFCPLPKSALDKNDKLVQNPGW